MADYKTPQWLLPNEKNLAYPASGDGITGSGLSEDRHSLYSMEFDGIDDYIKVDGLSNVLTNQDFTLSLWFKGTGQTTTADSSNMLFSAHGSSTSNILRIGIAKSSGGIYFAATGSSGSVVGSADYDDGNWYHLVITKPYVGGGAAGTVYINGSSIGNTEVFNIDFSSAINYSIGQEYDPTLSPGDFFKGNIDEVAIWNKILNNDEIAALSTASAPANLMALSAKPIAYYPLGEQAQMGYSNWNFPNGSLQSHVVDFDGTDDEIQLTSDFVAAGEFTLSLWINPDNVVDNNFLGDGSSSNNWIQIKTATQLKVKVASTVTTFNESGGNNLTASAWNHVLIYRNASNDVGVYVNGQTFGSTSTNTNTLTLSTIGRATGIFFEGNISNVAFWSSNQSANIANIYNNGSPQSTYTVTPTAWWKLNAANSSYVYPWTLELNGSPDVSGSGDHAKVVSNALQVQDIATTTNSGKIDFLTREITGAYSGINVTGEFVIATASAGQSGATLYYKIDGGSWVQFQQQLDTSGTTTYAISGASGLTSTTSFQVKIEFETGNAGSASVTLNDITIGSSSGNIYVESFENQDGAGWDNDIYTPPPVDWTFVDSLGSNNGTSDTLPTSALITSDLQFESPYSNYSLSFDGVGNYLDLTQQDLGINNSISLWIKPSSTAISTSANYTIIGEDSYAFDYILSINFFNPVLYFRVGSGYLGWDCPSIANTNWHSVVLVRDSLTTAKCYLDGVDQGAPDYSSGTYTGNTKLRYLGVNYPTNTQFFPGKIDELALWGSAITQAQVIQVYNNGYPNDLTSLSPSQWWRLGEDSYFVSNVVTIPNKITGGPSGTGSGTQSAFLVGDAPGSYANGLGDSLDVLDRVGDAPESTANSVSVNMIPSNRHSYPAGYLPTQVNNVYSMEFDGTDDYIDCGNPIPLQITGNLTLSTWVKTSMSSTGFVVSKDNLTNRNYGLVVVMDGGVLRARFFIFESNVLANVTSTTINIGDNNWHHIVGVNDGTDLKIYVDGNLEATNSGGGGTIDNDTVNLNIGRRSDNSLFFDGKIDEVAIFNYALSERQIKQDIYNGTTSGKTADLNNISNLTAPIAWYRMGD